MFCNYIVTTVSFFVITIHYVNIVLTPTVRNNVLSQQSIPGKIIRNFDIVCVEAGFFQMRSQLLTAFT